ncbi:MAG: 2-oxo acid dehydrogenase subunit E2 [Anaerolineae bacterium]|nr:2-oxo acid dehydrogenase subunit E2 [Anaerolineae bacterium]
MEVQIKMPDLATTEDEIRIVRWLVDVGQPVKLGQPLVEIETDKATMEVESIAAGTLAAIAVAEDQVAAVGQIIAVIESTEHSSQPAASPAPTALPHVTTPAKAAPTAPAPAAPAMSLFARNKMARQAQAQPTTIVLSGTERELAGRLQKSKQTIPHFYLNTSANADRMIALRQQSAPHSIVWDAFFVVAVARALREYPRMGYHFGDGQLVAAAADAVGVAADIDNALYVVVVDNPLAQTVQQVSQQITEKVQRIRQGDAAAKKLTPAAITVTNLGAENIESFAAIINPGESAILAIGKIAPAVVPVDHNIVIQQRVQLSLSVDHRVANGKYAAKFLSKVVTELESL